MATIIQLLKLLACCPYLLMLWFRDDPIMIYIEFIQKKSMIIYPISYRWLIVDV
jgi:hypothetical protein